MENMSEGKAGWGLRFPCWHINNTLIRLLIGKELTGYHFYMMLTFLLIFHCPFFFINWTFKKELITIGLYFWYWVIEDFIWFVESEYYGLRNFKKGKIYWHKRFLIGLPVSYWWSIIIGTLLILGGK
jgi:hypothetical protein